MSKAEENDINTNIQKKSLQGLCISDEITTATEGWMVKMKDSPTREPRNCVRDPDKGARHKKGNRCPHQQDSEDKGGQRWREASASQEQKDRTSQEK